MIQKESIQSLSEAELVEACFERGLQVLGYSAHILREQLKEWLKVSLNFPDVMIPFLIYAHAFVQRDFLLLSNDFYKLQKQ
jgi:hypothetical protein